MANNYSRVDIPEGETEPDRKETVLAQMPEWDYEWNLVRSEGDDWTYDEAKRGSSTASSVSERNVVRESSLTEPGTLSPQSRPHSSIMDYEASPEPSYTYPTNDIDRPPSPRTQMSQYQTKSRKGSVPADARPLNRYLAEIESFSDTSEDSTTVEKEWERLRELRANVLRNRTQLRIKRRQVRVSQSDKDRADDTFMKYVRGHISPGTVTSDPTTRQGIGSSLGEIFSALQETRDNYGPLADSYNILEDMVDEQEFEMAKLESRLYKTKLTVSVETANNTTQDADFHLYPAPPDSLLGLSTEISDNYHPLHADYLSKLGDLDLTMEQYHQMMQEHENLISLQQFRHRLGMELDEEGVKSLSAFPVRESDSLRHIEKIEKEVEQARERCLVEGIELNESLYGSEEEGPESARLVEIRPTFEEENTVSLDSPPNGLSLNLGYK